MRSCLKGDLSGKRFGYVVVQGPSEKRGKFGHKLWKCLCSCGTECSLTGTFLTTRKRVSCGCQKTNRTWTTENVGLNRLYDRYRYGAYYRNLPFELTKEQVLHLAIQNCFYCGSPPAQSMKASIKRLRIDFIYNGIDRVDSSLGYYYENCRACCCFCNIAKADLDEKHFFKMIKKISHKHKLYQA